MSREASECTAIDTQTKLHVSVFLNVRNRLFAALNEGGVARLRHLAGHVGTAGVAPKRV